MKLSFNVQVRTIPVRAAASLLQIFVSDSEDMDKVIVDKVFGERSVIRVQANPERTNVIAGVVRKV